MILNKIDFNDADAHQGARKPVWARRLVLTSLLVAFGTLFMAVWIEKNLDARGDRQHLTNPVGPEQTAALRHAGEDPEALNPAATDFLGTGWLEAIAMASGLLALLSTAWLCASAAPRSDVPAEDGYVRPPHVRT